MTIALACANTKVVELDVNEERRARADVPSRSKLCLLSEEQLDSFHWTSSCSCEKNSNCVERTQSSSSADIIFPLSQMIGLTRYKPDHCIDRLLANNIASDFTSFVRHSGKPLELQMKTDSTIWQVKIATSRVEKTHSFDIYTSAWIARCDLASNVSQGFQALQTQTEKDSRQSGLCETHDPCCRVSVSPNQ